MKRVFLISGNVLFILIGLILSLFIYGLIVGGFRGDMRITEHINATVLALVYILIWRVFNIVIKGRKIKIRSKGLLTSPLKICILIIIVILSFYFAKSLFYYYVPKHNYEELVNITIDDWKELSKTEKFRVGQSFYIRWKNSTKGFYNAGDYVSLIEDYINCTSGVPCLKDTNYQDDYPSVYYIIFYHLSGT